MAHERAPGPAQEPADPGEDTTQPVRVPSGMPHGPGETTVRLAPGERTVRIMPGDSTVRMVPPSGPGEETVVIGHSEPTVLPPAGSPKPVVIPGNAEEAVTLRLPAPPGTAQPTPDAQPAQPARSGPARAGAGLAEAGLAGAGPAEAGPPRMVRPDVPQTPADRIEPDVERRRATRGPGLGHAPWVLAVSSLGVALVALGYAGGRYENRYALAAYWIGQVVVFTPVVARLLSRRLAGVVESFTLVVGLAVNQYLLKWFYSPEQFRFPDELQHWLATTIINETGELFRPNLALPPAVHFPGLAEMGAAVSQLTGLSVTAAGILVAGVAHLCFVGGLYVAVLRASRSPSIAGVACAVYATALHYLFFNSMYLYQTAGLAFFMLTVWATRRWRAGNGRQFAVIAILGLVLTTVCHHVTALALVATLLLLAGVEVLTVRPRPWRALLVPALGLAVVASWIVLVARDVVSYLEDPVRLVGQTVQTVLDGGQSSASGTDLVAVPWWQLTIQGLGLLGLLMLYLAVGRDMLARRDRDPWRVAAVLGATIFFAGNGVRFLGTNGPEIAGRLSTFTYVPMSIIAATALVQAVRLLPPGIMGTRRLLVPSPPPQPARPGRTLTPRLLTGAGLATVLMVGARIGGWPPVQQLLPGPYRAAGYERSVEAYGLAAADWERTTLGPGQRVGGDGTAVMLASTYGRQDPVREVGPLYYSEQWSYADEQLTTQLGLAYLVVDKRLSENLPADQAYFEQDPQAGRITHPLTAGQIGKFDALPQWSRLYDNGQIRIYQLGTS